LLKSGGFCRKCAALASSPLAWNTFTSSVNEVPASMKIPKIHHELVVKILSSSERTSFGFTGSPHSHG
jgi:hypothetical protein